MATPSDPLDVVTNTNDKGFALHNGTTNLLFRLARNGSADNVFINMYSAGAVTNQIVSSGVSYFNAGNIGIGTTTPGRTLTVVGDIRATGILYDSTNAAGSGGNFLMRYSHWLPMDSDIYTVWRSASHRKRDEWICN